MFEIIEFAIAAIPLIILLVYYIEIFEAYPKVDNSPLCTVKCRIIDKEISVDAYRAVYTKHLITLESIYGVKIVLETTSTDYELLSVGDKGIVKYRSNKFISFERKKDFNESEVKENLDIRKEIKVVDKETLLLKVTNARVKNKFSQLGSDMTNMIYYITFEDETGSEIEFEVGEAYYNTLVVGDKGVLNYRENRFQSFKRE